jgi:hypothetical protein
VLVLTCDVDFGASGAPIFRMDGSIARIVSVVSAKGELAGRAWRWAPPSPSPWPSSRRLRPGAQAPDAVRTRAASGETARLVRAWASGVGLAGPALPR